MVQRFFFLDSGHVRLLVYDGGVGDAADADGDAQVAVRITIIISSIIVTIIIPIMIVECVCSSTAMNAKPAVAVMEVNRFTACPCPPAFGHFSQNRKKDPNLGNCKVMGDFATYWMRVQVPALAALLVSLFWQQESELVFASCSFA